LAERTKGAVIRKLSKWLRYWIFNPKNLTETMPSVRDDLVWLRLLASASERDCGRWLQCTLLASVKVDPFLFDVSINGGDLFFMCGTCHYGQMAI